RAGGENKRIPQQLIGERVSIRAFIMGKGKLTRNPQWLTEKTAVEKHQRRGKAQVGNNDPDEDNHRELRIAAKRPQEPAQQRALDSFARCNTVAKKRKGLANYRPVPFSMVHSVQKTGMLFA